VCQWEVFKIGELPYEQGGHVAVELLKAFCRMDCPKSSELRLWG
jgi:hypothetical protein